MVSPKAGPTRADVAADVHFPERFPLANLPTPLQEARRLRAALGPACPRIWLKRDDLTGLALGGNKARKLEFIVAAALRAGATALVTVGAAQSNHARMTAAAARMAGLKAVLVLSSDGVAPELEGNLLLDRILGAEITIVPGAGDKAALRARRDEAVGRVSEALRRRDERPYFVPVGGSTGLGALGYVAAFDELVEQLEDRGVRATRLYFPTGSGGTHAGLVLGQHLARSPLVPVGVAVGPHGPADVAETIAIAGEAAALIGSGVRIVAGDLRIVAPVDARYGEATAACVEAIDLMARTEGVLLDPVYSGKALAALVADVRAGSFDAADELVFLHTGGIPALFAHADIWAS